jgi:Zn-dependent protease
VYGESYGGEPGWVRTLRWLNGSFRLGRFFGVEVRVYWLVLVIAVLVCLGQFGGGDSVGTAALNVALVMLAVYLVVYVHEMGHVVAGRRFRIHTPLITLSPLGGLAHMSSAPPGPKAEAIVAGAGPVTHLLWMALAFPAERLLRPHVLEGGLAVHAWTGADLLWRLNLSLLLFNLLPLYPMDGGRVLRAFLAARMHPNRATILAARIGMVGAVGLLVWGLTMPSFYGGLLFAIAITNLFACWQAILLARHTPGPYFEGDRSEPWSADADAWKRGASELQEERRARRGVFARWRERRRARAAERERTEALVLEVEVDRILAKVSEVGMSGLTPAERATLKRASEVQRRGR